MATLPMNMIKKKVEESLFEKEGIQTISRRTIQSDIFNMRSDKFGYNAPIEVYERSYYRYSNQAFKLYDATLSKGEIQNLHVKRAVKSLKREPVTKNVQNTVQCRAENQQKRSTK